MGVYNAPAYFFYMMMQILRKLQYAIWLHYLDDVIAPLASFERNYYSFWLIFKVIRAFGLKLKPLKFKFLNTRAKIIEFITDKDGTQVDPTKLEAVANWPEPKTAKQLLRFLGTINYLHQYIPGCANISLLLTNLI